MIIKHEDGRKEVAVIDMEASIPKNHLAELIVQMKAEIAAEKERRKASKFAPQ